MAAPLILALDGSTRVCSAALLAADQPWPPGAALAWWPIAERAEIDERGQAKVLLRMIDDMLGKTGHDAAALRAIVVGTGPGTFTGVRIAVATARALSLALSVPITGISTLAALAAAAAAPDVSAAAAAAAGAGGGPEAPDGVDDIGLLVPVVDARRGQLFFGIYERASCESARGPRWVREAAYGVCDRQALAGIASKSGTRALVVAESAALVGELPDGVRLATEEVRAARLVIGQQALGEPGQGPEGARLDVWLAGTTEDTSAVVPETVKPIYVRPPDADIHITKMKDPWGDLPVGSPKADGR